MRREVPASNLTSRSRSDGGTRRSIAWRPLSAARASAIRESMTKCGAPASARTFFYAVSRNNGLNPRPPHTLSCSPVSLERGFITVDLVK